jgi:hypothetical protein
MRAQDVEVSRTGDVRDNAIPARWNRRGDARDRVVGDTEDDEWLVIERRHVLVMQYADVVTHLT